MKAVQISVLHIILLSMTVIGLKNHVTIIPAVLQSTGRDGWMSVLLGAAILFPWLFLLVYIHSASKQQRVKDWLQQTLGSFATTIITYSLIIYCILLAAFTMRETLLWVAVTFLPATPMLFLLIIYSILILVFISTNMQTMTIVNVIVLFGVVILGFFVAFVNISVKDYNLLLPFFEHGWEPVLIGSVYPASGFVELLLLLFLQHHVKGKISWFHWTIMLGLLAGLTLGPLVGAITEFGPIEAAKQRYPAYEEWGLATIGRFIEHIDFFSVYQWLTGAFIRIGLLLFIVVDLCGFVGQKKQIWTWIAPALFFSSLILSVMNDELFLDINEKYFLIATFVFFFILSWILTMAAFISRRASKKDEVT